MEIKSLDDIVAAYPLIFELRARLEAVIASETEASRDRWARLEASGLHPEDVYEKKQDEYSRLQMSLAPVRAELDEINKRLADIVALLPPKPFIITSSQAT